MPPSDFFFLLYLTLFSRFVHRNAQSRLLWINIPVLQRIIKKHSLIRNCASLIHVFRYLLHGQSSAAAGAARLDTTVRLPFRVRI